jgi:hypothetical protein
MKVPVHKPLPTTIPRARVMNSQQEGFTTLARCEISSLQPDTFRGGWIRPIKLGQLIPSKLSEHDYNIGNQCRQYFPESVKRFRFSKHFRCRFR